jgi:hypothetical protein
LWLWKKFDRALTQRDNEMEVIMTLLQLRNPHGNGEENYTVNFFCSQWNDQVRVALQQKDEDEEQKKIAAFLLNEEVLELYK